jgi:hypothetical protein
MFNQDQKKAKSVLALAVVTIVLLFSTAASADTFTFSVGNSALSSAPLPFGTITLNQVNASTINFSIVMAHYAPNSGPNTTSSDIQYAIGNGGFEFNLASTANLSLSAVSATNVLGGSFGNTFALSTGSSNYDGFGALNVNIATTNNGNNNPNAAKTLSFTLTRTVGTLAISDFQALTSSNCPTPNPCTFVAHVNEWDTVAQSNIKTGFGGTRGPDTTVPEPASLALFGSGLLGLGGIVRRKLAIRSL